MVNRSKARPSRTRPIPPAWRSWAPAPDLAEDLGYVMVVEDADTRASGRRRAIGELDASVSSALMAICAVYAAVSGLELDRSWSKPQGNAKDHVEASGVAQRLVEQRRGSVAEADGPTITGRSALISSSLCQKKKERWSRIDTRPIFAKGTPQGRIETPGTKKND